MNTKTSTCLISLLAICLFALAGFAQSNYSESAEYKPRPIATPTPTPKNERKKKSADKDRATMVPVSNVAPVAGDITVTIPVRVVDRSGSPIRGLKKEDVSVFVDGTDVPVVGFEQDKDPITMILVLDSSPSGQLKFKTMKEQASKLVGELPLDMKVMVIDFNSKFNVRSQPTTDREVTRKAISKVSMGAGTSIYSVVEFIYEEAVPQVPGRKVMVVMTDGVDTQSQNTDYAKSLTEVEKEDVIIYPVYLDTFNDLQRISTGPNLPIQLRGTPSTIGTTGAEYNTGINYLNDLALATGGRTFYSDKLADGTKAFLEELANRYYVTITVPRKNAGSRPLRVRINRPSLGVIARGSFVEK